jgi:hypothetical protein
MKGMEIEHLQEKGSRIPFKTTNYKITTCPETEWRLVTATDERERDKYWNLSNSKIEKKGSAHRKKPFLAEHKQKQLYVESNMIEEELIAVVLYTGPMVQFKFKFNMQI